VTGLVITLMYWSARILRFVLIMLGLIGLSATALALALLGGLWGALGACLIMWYVITVLFYLIEP
jgi:hypothetical protein